ncbi:MAG: GNAT family N-acetyltransferase [Candidatus Eisenbacteria sp.]|nr:GNAT family N-acetyltransferase [Candidatus Eisenbacteria bacterium]
MIEIVEVPAEDAGAWDEFVEDSNNGTLFHSLKFLAYHEPGDVDSRSLLFRRSGRTLALLPGALMHRDGEVILVSPWGGSFGGFVLRGGESYETVEALVDSLLVWCREQKIDGIELTHAPGIYMRSPNQLMEFVLLSKGFDRFRYEVTDVIPLQGGEDGVKEQWQASARKAVRKSQEAGMVVRESGDLDLFYPILEENRLRHGARPTHTLAQLRRLFELVPDRLKLLLAYREGDVLGGALIFLCNQRVVMNFYLCHVEGAGRYRPADAVMAESILAAIRWGAAYYDLGTSSLGGVPNPGLLRFKGKWGSTPFLREAYQLGIVSG